MKNYPFFPYFDKWATVALLPAHFEANHNKNTNSMMNHRMNPGTHAISRTSEHRCKVAARVFPAAQAVLPGQYGGTVAALEGSDAQ